MPATKTALVLKPITRCEFGTMAQGLMAETFDRVEVLGSISFSSTARQHKCKTERGEVFYANDSMVQLDEVACG